MAFILKEDGDFLLKEDGDKLLLDGYDEGTIITSKTQFAASAASCVTERVSALVVEVAAASKSGNIQIPGPTQIAGTGAVSTTAAGGVTTSKTQIDGSAGTVPPSGQVVSQETVEIAGSQTPANLVSELGVEISANTGGPVNLSALGVEISADTGGEVSLSQLVIEMAYIASGETSQVFFI